MLRLLLRALRPTVLLAVLLAACAPDTPPDSPVSAPAAPPLARDAPPTPREPVPHQASPEAALTRAEAFAARLDRLAVAPGARAGTRTAELPNPIADGGPPRRVTRFASGRAVRLTVTEPDDGAAMTGASVYYLDAGALVFVRGPFARYAFDGDRLAAWADERGSPVSAPPESRAARAAALRDEAARYAALFSDAARSP